MALSLFLCAGLDCASTVTVRANLDVGLNLIAVADRVPSFTVRAVMDCIGWFQTAKNVSLFCGLAFVSACVYIHSV